jgi:predicted ester cyclase
MNALEENKALVRRLVDEVINEGDTDVIDELFAPELAPRMRRLFSSFRSAFPDWREEIVELVAEGDLVAGRFNCRGTHWGEFLGVAPTGRRQEVDEVFFLRVEGGRFVSFWALEDTHARSRQLDLTGRQSDRRRSAPARPASRRADGTEEANL